MRLRRRRDRRRDEPRGVRASPGVQPVALDGRRTRRRLPRPRAGPNARREARGRSRARPGPMLRETRSLALARTEAHTLNRSTERQSWFSRPKRSNHKESGMTTKRFVLSLALLLPAFAGANEEIQQLTGDPNNWATWGGDYAGTRYSTLAQIDK